MLDITLATLFGLLALPVRAPDRDRPARASGRPILYRGERVGRRGRFFEMLKFRTMRPGAEERIGQYLGEELVHATEDELTTLGRWLKVSQLDEIPQLWNVLRGDMSFVGPRPIRPRFFAELAHDLPAYWQRLVVRPGLTGFAQVRHGYETSMAEKLAHDLEWIADRSVRLYLRTVVVTGFRVVAPGPRPASTNLDRHVWDLRDRVCARAARCRAAACDVADAHPSRPRLGGHALDGARRASRRAGSRSST